VERIKASHCNQSGGEWGGDRARNTTGVIWTAAIFGQNRGRAQPTHPVEEHADDLKVGLGVPASVMEHGLSVIVTQPGLCTGIEQLSYNSLGAQTTGPMQHLRTRSQELRYQTEV
jgi:hypothetical protein